MFGDGSFEEIYVGKHTRNHRLPTKHVLYCSPNEARLIYFGIEDFFYANLRDSPPMSLPSTRKGLIKALLRDHGG